MFDLKYVDEYVELNSMSSESLKRKNKQEIVNFFTNVPDSYNDLTKSDIIKAFEQRPMHKKSSFISSKCRLVAFSRWMYEQGLFPYNVVLCLDAVQYSDLNYTEFYASNFYRNFDDLYNTLDIIFDFREDFQSFCVSAMLIWHGIKQKYLSDLLKIDLDESNQTIMNPENHESIQLDYRAFQYTLDYARATQYESERLGSRITIPYIDSEYLFRSYKNRQISHISQLATNANKVAKAQNYDKHFNYSYIYQSGLYYRMYQHEKEHGEFQNSDEILLKFFDINSSDKQHEVNYVYLNLEAYRNFKKYMISE